MNRYFLAILTTYILARGVSFAQTVPWDSPERKAAITALVDDKNIDESLLRDALLLSINAEMEKQGAGRLESNESLSNAASDYASYLAKIDDAKPGQGGKKQSLAYRLKMYGGAANSCTELCTKTNVKKGKEQQSYKDLADDVVFKWFASKAADVFKDPKYLVVGVGGKPDATGKKAYISVILGNFNTINEGAVKVKESGLPLSTSSQGIKPYDAKICKNCERFKGIDTLQKGLLIDGNNIYLEADFKSLKRIIKNPTDGIAIDIVSRSQYPCDGTNIIDKTLPSRGYMTKKIMQPKLLKANMYEGKEAKTKFKTLVGTVPPGMTDFELNLVVFQDKVFCKNIRHSYAEVNSVSNKSKLRILGDTITFYNDFDYKPKPDTTFLSFKIPFELGKSEYNPDDIKPLIEALNEPDFIIISLKITSFSSIEGREEKNVELRQARAESIVKAFQQLQKGEQIKADIQTSDSWELFFKDIKGTPWDSLRKKTADQVREIIQTKKLEALMEPILSNERFARVEMRVIYDLRSMQKEQGFVLKKFHQALDSGDIVQALNIQKYIIKKVRRGVYSKYIVPQMQIPRDSVRFAGMQMNKIWLDYVVNNRPVDSLFYQEVTRLSKLDPKNEYITYNKLYCEIKIFDLTEEANIGVMQQKIDALRTSRLRKSDVDPLNVEFQVKIIQSLGNTLKVNDEAKVVADCLARIKSIIDLNAGDWKNALNMAALFIQMDDFEYPATLLEPFVMNSDADEKVIFTYLSACTHSDFKPLTKPFETALAKAFEKNKSRTCTLFDQGDMSFQIFENPNVKKMVCEKCGK